jgi:hypothetical protein
MGRLFQTVKLAQTKHKECKSRKLFPEPARREIFPKWNIFQFPKIFTPAIDAFEQINHAPDTKG